MKKLFLLLIISVAFTASSLAQWEYQYFSFRIGLNHNLFSPQPDLLPLPGIDGTPDRAYKMLYFKNEGGSVPLQVATGSDKLFYYGVGLSSDLLFHFDLKNNKLGFVTGVQYSSQGLGTKLLTEDKEYTLIEKYRAISVGMPLMIKFGNNIYRDMSYFFIGGQVNYNMDLKEQQELKHTDKPDVTENDYGTSGTVEKLKPINTLFFCGYNYSIFNLEVGLMPDNFLDINYVELVPGGEASPFENQSKNIFYIKTSIHIPISEWSVSKSWQLEKIRRKFKRF